MNTTTLGKTPATEYFHRISPYTTEAMNVSGSVYERSVSLSISLSLLCTIHNLHSVYTQLLGLLSVSYSQTIKLLTVWLIVPQFDFRGTGEGSAESVSEVWRESGLRVRAALRSVAFLRVARLSRFNWSRRGGDALAEESWWRSWWWGSVFALVLEGPGRAANTMGKLSRSGSARASS